MTVREILLPWTQQPQEAVGASTEAVSAGLCYLWGMPQGSTRAAIRNLVDGSLAASQDGNNELVATPCSMGLAGINSASTDANALRYLTTSLSLHAASELTLLAWFEFRSAGNSAQWLNFRENNQHTLDVFSQTTTSVTWGSDWAGAWNGASQQTLSGLVDRQFVCIGASINANGARFFANGAFSGTKSGSSFVTSSASGFVVAEKTRLPLYGSAAFRAALSDERMQAYTGSPWQLFEDQGIRVPISAAPAVPSITAVSAENITATSADYRVTLDFA